MKKFMKKYLVLSLVVLMMVSLVSGCAKEENATFDGQNVRVVIGSTSITGDSYFIADTAMRYLSEALNANTKIDAVGAGPAFEAISTAKPDGSTIMMFHDMTYLGISFGAFDEKYALENMEIGPRVGLNPGACFATSVNAPYNDMVEIVTYLQANPSEIVRVGIEAGGVSHIAFISYYEWVVEEYGQEVADRIRVIVGGSTAEKAQMLWDGNTDVIFADFSSLLQYTEAGVDDKIKMKFVGLLDSIDGVEIPTYADMGITLNGEPFVFSKEFVIYLPKGADPALIAELDKAAEEISKDPEFIEAMAKLTYKVDYLPSAEAKAHTIAKRDSLDALIKGAPSLDILTLQ